MRHFAFHLGDYAAATAHLSDAEDLAYRRLLDAYYAREAPLPVDEAACCRLARATTLAARKAVAVVLGEFFALEPDGWHQVRCDAEIAAYKAKSDSARSAVNVRHERDRESRKLNDERRAESRNSAYERNTDAQRPNDERDTSRIPTSNQEP